MRYIVFVREMDEELYAVSNIVTILLCVKWHVLIIRLDLFGEGSFRPFRPSQEDKSLKYDPLRPETICKTIGLFFLIELLARFIFPPFPFPLERKKKS